MIQFLFNKELKFRLVRHLTFFGFTVLLFSLFLFLQNNESSFFQSLSETFKNGIFFFAYAYLTIFLLIPEFLIKRKIWWFIMFFVISGVALSALKLIISDQIFYAAISPENVSRHGVLNLKYIIINTKDMTFIVALFCVAKYVKDYIYIDKIRKELADQTKVAQRKLFQSQFDPHFLFNTINNLYALSMLNPEKTQEVIYRIKIVLNYIIQEIQKDFVSLLDEISLVENYIQLEKLRYGERLKVDYNTNGELSNAKIPPMILFYLVENSFKHGSSLDAGNPWITVNIDAEWNKTKIVVENSKPVNQLNQQNKKLTQTLLTDLEKRLNIIYGRGGYSLIVLNNDNIFKVELNLKEEIDIQRNKYR